MQAGAVGRGAGRQGIGWVRRRAIRVGDGGARLEAVASDLLTASARDLPTDTAAAAIPSAESAFGPGAWRFVGPSRASSQRSCPRSETRQSCAEATPLMRHSHALPRMSIPASPPSSCNRNSNAAQAIFWLHGQAAFPIHERSSFDKPTDGAGNGFRLPAAGRRCATGCSCSDTLHRGMHARSGRPAGRLQADRCTTGGFPGARPVRNH